MSRRMSKTERAADIAARCGFSVDTVNAVLKAERESMVESLKHGEKVTLAGRVIVTPTLRSRITYRNGQPDVQYNVAATAKPIQSLLDELAVMENYIGASDAETSEEEDIAKIMKENGIVVKQIAALE